MDKIQNQPGLRNKIMYFGKVPMRNLKKATKLLPHRFLFVIFYCHNTNENKTKLKTT